MKKKLGIIDIFILLVFVIVTVFAFKKYGKKTAIVENTRQVSITLMYGQVPKDIANNLKLEGTVMDEQRQISLGDIKDLKLEDGYVFTLSDGELLKNKAEHYKTVYITTQTEAVVFDNGISISGNKYEIGHPFKIIANGNLLSCKVVLIKEN